MRVRTFVVGAAVAAASVVGLAAPAFAGVHTPTYNPNVTASFSYNDYTFGPVSCTETHHFHDTLPAKVAAGNSTTGGWDRVHCTSTTGQPLTNVTGGQTGSIGWNSDWGTQYDQSTGTLQFTVAKHAKSVSGVAWYPNG
jgi:hypothetical protein